MPGNYQKYLMRSQWLFSTALVGLMILLGPLAPQGTPILPGTYDARATTCALAWGGLMVGPRSARQLPDEPVERRTLLTFLAGINIAYDLIPAKQR